MQPQNEKSVFRIRGLKCSVCEIVNEVFGNDPDPAACLNCNAAPSAFKLLWDHIVTKTARVEDTPKQA